MILRLVFDPEKAPDAAALVGQLRPTGFRVTSRHSPDAFEILRGEIPDHAVPDARQRLSHPVEERELAWWEFHANTLVEALRVMVMVLARRREQAARLARGRTSRHDPQEIGTRRRLETACLEWGASEAETTQAVELLARRGWIRVEETGAGGIVRLTNAGALVLMDWDAGRRVELVLPDDQRCELTRNADDDVEEGARSPKSPPARRTDTIGLVGRTILFNASPVGEFKTTATTEIRMLQIILDRHPRACSQMDFPREIRPAVREHKRRLSRKLFNACGIEILRRDPGILALVEGVVPKRPPSSQAGPATPALPGSPPAPPGAPPMSDTRPTQGSGSAGPELRPPPSSPQKRPKRRRDSR